MPERVNKKRIADGSGRGDPLDAAAVRAIDAYKTISRKADRLANALDEITAPGVVKNELSEEDSLVIAIADVRAGTTRG